MFTKYLSDARPYCCQDEINPDAFHSMTFYGVNVNQHCNQQIHQTAVD